jgi:hypothetical protein
MSRNFFIIAIILITVIAGLIVGFLWLRYGVGPRQGLDRLEIFGGTRPSDLSLFDRELESGPPFKDSVSLPILRLPRLIQLTRDGVVGPTMVRGEKRVKYFKRATGHLYRIDEEGRQGEERISNLTIAGARHAVWSPNKNHAVVTFLTDGIQKHFAVSYTATSSQSKEVNSQGIFLPSDISGIAFALRDERMAYLLPTGSASTLFVASSDGSGQKSVYTTALSQLNLSWAGDEIGITAKASGLAPSFAQRITLGGSSRIIARDIEGLDIKWNAQGTSAVISRTSLRGKNLANQIINAKGEVSAQLPFATIASKCAWSRLEEDMLYCAVPRQLPRATYPDAWWQGTVSFSDNLWRINGASGETDQIFNEGDFDMIDLFLSEAEDRLFFLNKKDSTLWSLRLEE